MVYERVNDEPGIHFVNRVSAGYHAKMYFMPDNVNFYNCRHVEQDNLPNYVTGDYHLLPPITPLFSHSPSTEPGLLTDEVWPGKGTRLEGTDFIGFNFWCRGDKDPSLFGVYSYRIGQFVVDEYGLDHGMDIVNQTSINIGGVANSEFNLDKWSAQLPQSPNATGALQTRVEDPTNLYNALPSFIENVQECP